MLSRWNEVTVCKGKQRRKIIEGLYRRSRHFEQVGRREKIIKTASSEQGAACTAARSRIIVDVTTRGLI